MIVVYVCDEKYLRYVEKSAQSLLKIHHDVKIVIVSPHKLNTKYENIVIKLPEGYKTMHDYKSEEDFVLQMEESGFLKIN